MPTSVFPLAKPLERPVCAHGLYRPPPLLSCTLCSGETTAPQGCQGSSRCEHDSQFSVMASFRPPAWQNWPLCLSPPPSRSTVFPLLLRFHTRPGPLPALRPPFPAVPLLRSGQNPGLSLSPLCSLPDGTVWASDLEHSRHLGASCRLGLDLLPALTSHHSPCLRARVIFLWLL